MIGELGLSQIFVEELASFFVGVEGEVQLKAIGHVYLLSQVRGMLSAAWRNLLRYVVGETRLRLVSLAIFIIHEIGRKGKFWRRWGMGRNLGLPYV